MPRPSCRLLAPVALLGLALAAGGCGDSGPAPASSEQAKQNFADETKAAENAKQAAGSKGP